MKTRLGRPSRPSQHGLAPRNTPSLGPGRSMAGPREHEPKRDPNNRRTLAANLAGSVAAERPPSCRFQERRPRGGSSDRTQHGATAGRRGNCAAEAAFCSMTERVGTPFAFFHLPHGPSRSHENYAEKLTESLFCFSSSSTSPTGGHVLGKKLNLPTN